MQSKQKKKQDNRAAEDAAGDSLQLLLKNITSLNRAVKLQTVLRESLDVIQNVMDVEASSLLLVDEVTDELIVSIPTGPVQNEIQGKRLEKGVGISGWVTENKKTYYSNDVERDENFGGELSEEFTTKNIICTPLYKRDRSIFGVLQAINRLDNKEFSDRDVKVFEALAEHVAIAIERTREIERLQQELDNRELMLREVHHRIKNNLSTLTALIEMEYNEVKDSHAEKVLRTTCSRIESMTEVHDLLHNSGLTYDINLSAYLKRLTGKIVDTISDPAQKVAVEMEMEPIHIDTERAMSCGLLINELLVNAYKHAFKNSPEGGNIFIRLKQTEDDYINLTVSDDGAGIDKNFSFDHSGSIGSWLINVILRRLNATVDIKQGNGARFLIRFKK